MMQDAGEAGAIRELECAWTRAMGGEAVWDVGCDGERRKHGRGTHEVPKTCWTSAESLHSVAPQPFSAQSAAASRVGSAPCLVVLVGSRAGGPFAQVEGGGGGGNQFNSGTGRRIGQPG